jgi:hypothetical protein
VACAEAVRTSIKKSEAISKIDLAVRRDGEERAADDRHTRLLVVLKY